MPVDKNMPILIVDDAKNMQQIIRNLLKRLGFENVDDASDGGYAYAKLKEKNYGLVISDWAMQPVSGFELLKKVRRDERLKSLPFILITSENNSNNVIAAKKAGVSAYILKPFNADTLKSRLVQIIGEF